MFKTLILEEPVASISDVRVKLGVLWRSAAEGAAEVLLALEVKVDNFGCRLQVLLLLLLSGGCSCGKRINEKLLLRWCGLGGAKVLSSQRFVGRFFLALDWLGLPQVRLGWNAGLGQHVLWMVRC